MENIIDINFDGSTEEICECLLERVRNISYGVLGTEQNKAKLNTCLSQDSF